MTKNSKIVLFVLILVLLGAYILYYSFQVKSPPDELTQEQRDTAIVEMKERIATNPPVSQSERDKALQELKNRMK